MSKGSGNLLLNGEMTAEKASKFLEECAVYFEQRPTGGEDSAYWANVYNAEWCNKIAAYVTSAEQKLRTTSLEALAISDTNNEFQARLSEAVKVLERAETALNDWLNIYASDMCEENRVAEAHKRVSEYGTIGYIADVTAEIRGVKAFIATLGGEKE